MSRLRSKLWRFAACAPAPRHLSFSLPAVLVERLLTRDNYLQRRAMRIAVASATEGILLDLGCGGGRYLKLWPWVRIGVDINDKRLRTAARHGSIATRMDLRNEVPYFEGVSCVTCLEVVEHLERADALKLLQRLREFPVVVLSTPREWFEPNRDGYERHLSFWTLTQLSALGYLLVESVDVPPSNIYLYRKELQHEVAH